MLIGIALIGAIMFGYGLWRKETRVYIATSAVTPPKQELDQQQQSLAAIQYEAPKTSDQDSKVPATSEVDSQPETQSISEQNITILAPKLGKTRHFTVSRVSILARGPASSQKIDFHDRLVAGSTESAESSQESVTLKTFNQIQNSVPPILPNQPPKEVAMCPMGQSDFWLSFGIGANYTHIQQKRTELNANYRGISAPSIILEGGVKATETSSFAMTYKKTPGSADNSGLGAGKFTYEWDTIGLEGQSLLSCCQPTPLRYWTLLYGFQFHSLPIVVYDTSTFDPTLRKILYLNASLGVRYQYHVSANKFFVISSRYQHPISNSGPGGTSLEIASPLIFDGSVGGEYKMADSVWGGLHWYGQLHSYKIRYIEGSTLNEGSQNIFYSNFEFRLTLRF